MSDIAKELAEKIIHAQRQYAGGQFYSMLTPIIRETLDPLLTAADGLYGRFEASQITSKDAALLEAYKKARGI